MTLRVQRVLVGTLAVLLAVLFVTGVVLVFTYRPELGPPWNTLPEAAGRHMPPARLVHRWASLLVVPVAVGLFAVTLARRYSGGDRRQPVVLAGLSIPLLWVFQFTGYLLPWDQLALWAVRAGSPGYRGVLKASFDDTVRFILIGGVEVSQGTYRWWMLVHTLLLTAVLVAVVVLCLRRRYAPSLEGHTGSVRRAAGRVVGQAEEPDGGARPHRDHSDPHQRRGE